MNSEREFWILDFFTKKVSKIFGEFGEEKDDGFLSLFDRLERLSDVEKKNGGGREKISRGGECFKIGPLF